jgi:hydrogenase maturation protease
MHHVRNALPPGLRPPDDPIVNAPLPAVRLLVCGNADRGDDGAALAAVAHFLPRLEDAIRHRLEVRRCAELDATDLANVPDHQTCIVVDTVVGVDAGTVVTMPLSELAESSHGIAARSSRALPISQVLSLAAGIRGRLPDGTFIGIGGRRFGFGGRRSRAVTSGMRAFERATEGEVRRLASAALVAGPGGGSHPGV